MTTSAPAKSTLTFLDAMTSLACLTGLDTRRGFSLPSDTLDVWFASIGAATYPTLENTERKFDAFEVVSARIKISVDSLQDWFDRWYEQLVDHDHLAVFGLRAVNGELVRS